MTELREQLQQAVELIDKGLDEIQHLWASSSTWEADEPLMNARKILKTALEKLD